MWVQQTEELESGEIGIFYLDGNAYCKKLDCSRAGTFLVSLNQKYDPIQITKNNSFKIFWKSSMLIVLFMGQHIEYNKDSV